MNLRRALPSTHGMYLISSVVVASGSLITISAAFWDVMHHVLNRPESFFTPPHALLYSGIAVALVGSVLTFASWRRLAPTARSVWQFPFRLGILGIFVLVLAGPADFAWHDAFGLDGLLSPPHQMLLTGMFLTAIGPMIAIVRYSSVRLGKSGRPHGALVAFSLLPVWMCATGYLQSYTLPFSQTAYFDFNPDIWFGAVFATASMPFMNATVFVLVARLARLRFGVMSCFGLALLIINAASMPLYNPALVHTAPFYFVTMVPIVAADLLVSIYRSERGLAAAVIGSTFYFMFYPFVTYTYNEVIFGKVISGSVTFHVFFEQLPIVLPLTVGPAIAMGLLGAAFSRRILRRLLLPEEREGWLDAKPSITGRIAGNGTDSDTPAASSNSYQIRKSSLRSTASKG